MRILINIPDAEGVLTEHFDPDEWHDIAREMWLKGLAMEGQIEEYKDFDPIVVTLDPSLTAYPETDSLTEQMVYVMAEWGKLLRMWDKQKDLYSHRIMLRYKMIELNESIKSVLREFAKEDEMRAGAGIDD